MSTRKNIALLLSSSELQTLQRVNQFIAKYESSETAPGTGSGFGLANDLGAIVAKAERELDVAGTISKRGRASYDFQAPLGENGRGR